ncbi:MAG TPA: hypothetical protein VF794_33935 [Archangium sp.]|jgi:hypothetical protein|uniref:hypothetical protein n=1 Tax=Archangium sp. TaxID=1872627 RepID=UPI002ED9BE31
MVVALLLASLLSVTPAEPASHADPTISLARSMEGRHARLLDGLELAATFKPSITPALRITDSMRFGLMGAPLPLDTGGGVDAEVRQALALILGLFIGFGTGHLIARDKDGFLLFLIVDLAIIVVSSVFKLAVGGWFWGLGGAALLISHVIQGIDALGKAGGPRLVEATRQRAVQVADMSGGRDTPPITTRAFALSF